MLLERADALVLSEGADALVLLERLHALVLLEGVCLPSPPRNRGGLGASIHLHDTIETGEGGGVSSLLS